MRSLTTGVLTLALAAALAAPALAAEPGDILMRLRGIGFMTDTSGTTDAFGGQASTSNDYVPELDFSYFFTKHISAELILATTKHRVKVKDSTAGDLNLGTVRALPPVLTLQYHFNPDGRWNPYVGAGINYTLIFDDNLSVAGVPLGLDSSSVGLALQGGLDVKINERWAFNVDVKYAKLASGVYAGATKLTEAQLDPVLYALGLRYEF